MVVFASALVSYLVYKHDYVQSQLKDEHKNLMHTVSNVSRLIQFYQRVVDTITKQHVVADLLQFGTPGQAQQWASDMQRLLPDSIGMALFDPNGRVRGVLSELRLSDQCMMDMQLRIKGMSVPEPPVHRKIEELAHFDIVAPVEYAGENIGLVFASFNLKSIEAVLEDTLTGNQQLSVIAPDGYILAQVGQLDAEEKIYTKVISIPGTDWSLESKFVLAEAATFVRTISINNIVIFLLLTILFVIAMSRFFKIIIADFEIISNMMRHIQDGSFERQGVQNAHLKETEGVIAYMRFLATELALHQKTIHDASITDELTGLNNRRVLNQELDHCLELAKRGESFGVVILDLDHFKVINDTAGHDVGDQILLMLAEILKENCEESDVCVRVGGDEFVVILVGYNRKKIEKWYVSVLNEFQQRAYSLKQEIGGHERCGISAGSTMIRKDDDRSSLLKRADEALYAAKDKGRCNIQFAD
ncbi:MAG TPA: diguanylate cyclase [Gammaproteobacteria bacterium]